MDSLVLPNTESQKGDKGKNKGKKISRTVASLLNRVVKIQ